MLYLSAGLELPCCWCWYLFSYAPILLNLAAFEAIGYEKFLEDQWLGHLQSILLYHVLGSKVMSTDLSLGLTAESLEGSDVEVTSFPDPVMINEATVTQADVEARYVSLLGDMIVLPSIVDCYSLKLNCCKWFLHCGSCDGSSKNGSSIFGSLQQWCHPRRR